MSERKVLNKYYPPDFDPTKIPRSKVPRSDTFAIRVMAPFNMRCNNCGEYIYKGKKFNSRKETVQDEFYLGLRIFRFYIKCPRCVSEIAFKTDLENCDYALEAGATRNFEAQRTAELMAKKEMEEKEEEDKNNPMKVLENRTKASRDEMDMLETLEDLKELNSRNAKVNTETMVKKYRVYEQELKRLQDEEDEKFVQSIFNKTEHGSVKRIMDEDEFDNTTVKRKAKMENPTDILTEGSSDQPSGSNKGKKTWYLNKTKKNKPSLGIVVRKKTETTKSTNSSATSEHIGETSEKTVTTTNNDDDTKCDSELPDKADDGALQKSADKIDLPVATSSVQPTVTSSGALGMLGDYSDSSESD